MSLFARLPRATGPAVLGSIVSLGSQAVFALFLLKLFQPSAVGTFSMVSQVAFSWATLALAQSTVSLLADPAEPLSAARRAWRASLWRMLWLTPFAAFAWFWAQAGSGASNAGLLAWIAAMGLAQLSWSMAQSLTLRTGPAKSVFLVRCLPSMLAAGLTWLCARLFLPDQPTALLIAAFAGYLVGALWLLPALAAHGKPVAGQVQGTDAVPRGDPRTARLKMAHTFFDLVASTLIAVQWTRSYGAVEAGFLLVLLRVLGFVPGLVHTAWAQVLLAQGNRHARPSLVVGVLSCAAIAVLAGMLEIALAAGWLAPAWAGLRGYLWPVAAWQMAAAMFAAFSHFPFTRGQARAYSLQCMGVDTMLIAALLAAPLTGLAPRAWLLVVAGMMTAALSAQAWYFRSQAARDARTP